MAKSRCHDPGHRRYNSYVSLLNVARIANNAELLDYALLATAEKGQSHCQRLRNAKLARDRHYSFSGCTHNRWLDTHHVMHWIDGSSTSTDNTMLLCSGHHRLLHEGGYRIKKNFKGDGYFETAAGWVLAA